MVRLKTLGVLAVDGPDGPLRLDEAGQPKRLALLAYLAVNAKGGVHRRDTLVALLWPELDQARARAALRKALHHLRSALSPDVVVTRGDEEVLLNPAMLWCDARALREAAAAGAHAEAVGLYGGEFLTGLHAIGAPEFEAWLERQRDELRVTSTACALELGMTARTLGRLKDAIRWAREAVEISPLDERPNRLLIELLAEVGDAPAALSVYARFADHLAAELQIQPSAETQQIAELLRSSTSTLRAQVPRGNDGPPPVAVGRRSRVSRPKVRRAAELLVVAGLLGIVAWRAGLPRAQASDTASPLSIGNGTQVTAEEGLEIHGAISPDGRLIVYAAWDKDVLRLFLRPVAGGSPIQLTADGGSSAYQPRWSPDGREILFLTRNSVFIMPSLGGPARRIASRSDGRPFNTAAWAPDGRRIVLVRAGTLSVLDLASGNERELSTSPYPLHSCEWSPADDWIACVSGNWNFVAPGVAFGNLGPSTIVLIPTSGGPLSEITDRTALYQSPVWASDGRLYYVSDHDGPRDVYAVEIARDGRPIEPPRRVTVGLGAHSIGFSRDGTRLVYVAYAARANIWSLPIPEHGASDIAGAVPVTSGNQTVEAMRVSRDGRWLVYDSNLYGNFDIFRMPLSGGPAQRLTNHPRHEFAPDLSPDGLEIAYHAWHGASREVFVQGLHDDAPQQLTAAPGQETNAVWSPDGSALAYTDIATVGGTGTYVARRDSSGTWRRPIHLGAGRRVRAWSPDGRFLVYTSRRTVEIADPVSGRSRVLYERGRDADNPVIPGIQGAVVSEDSRTIYFKSHDLDNRASIWSIPVGGGQPRLLVRFDDLLRPSSRGEFAAGGGRFFFTIEERQSDIWVAEVRPR